MGWSSGTQIFDDAVGAILESDASEHHKIRIIIHLIDTLFRRDWDCECESDYFKHPLVKTAFILFDPSYIDYYEEIEQD